MTLMKTVLGFGLICGAVATVIQLVTLPFIRSHDFLILDYLGYGSIVLTALLLFFGIRSYREGAGGGRLTFARGLAVGALIAVVSSLCYAATFHVVYFWIEPGFGDHMAACMVERARAAGEPDESIAAIAERAQTLKRLYDNALTNAALTFVMTWPIGLVVSGISAAILRRR
jgi:hypothetical protein